MTVFATIFATIFVAMFFHSIKKFILEIKTTCFCFFEEFSMVSTVGTAKPCVTYALVLGFRMRMNNGIHIASKIFVAMTTRLQLTKCVKPKF